MLRSSGRRLALIGVVAGALALGAAEAAADPFAHWSGTRGPYAWEAKRLSCGVVGEKRSRLRAHTRWSTSPKNGYQRVTFIRQIKDDDTGAWTTVQRQRRSTRNTRLEGTRGILHWTQFFGVPAENAGKTSRHIVIFEWLRDRVGVDNPLFRRSRTFKPCVVGG